MSAPVPTGLVESPRYACSLGGGIATAASIHRVVPIIHAGPGCGMQLFNGLQYVAGYQGAGYVGSSATPSTNAYEREVVFGGEDRLRQIIESTAEIMDADLYVVLTGCVSEIIGDDVRTIVGEFRDNGLPIAYAETSGFKGLTRTGYERVLEALFDALVEPAPRNPRLVNLLGVVPSADVFWQGNIEEITRLLEQLGLEVNTFFTRHQGIEVIRTSSAAALNIVLSSDLGDALVDKYHGKYGVPSLCFDGVPLGPTATSSFLRVVGQTLEIAPSVVERVIDRNVEYVYDYFERAALAFTGMGFQHRVAVVGDAGTVVSLTRFLADDFGQVPVAAVVTDPLSDAGRERVAAALSKLETVAAPRVEFTADQRTAWSIVSEAKPSYVLGSSLDKDIAEELGALHLSVSFPVTDRVVLNRAYAGYRGAITLAEDYFAPALTAL